MLILALLAGCTDIPIKSPATFKQPPKGPPPGPPKLPRLLFVSPNVAPEATGAAFEIEAVNLLPDSPAVVSFGALTFNGVTNSTGSRVLNASGGSFNAPPGTGVIDLEVFISGQNPPTLQLTNAFYYLPTGSPALPTVINMTPNVSDEFGGLTTIFQGTNVSLAAGYQIVVSFLFSTGTVNVVGVQTATDTWSCPIPAVPAAENFTSGTLQVSVTVSFSSGGLPIPIIVAPPTSQADGNPFRYSIASNPPDPDPNEFVVASGLVAPGTFTMAGMTTSGLAANAESFMAVARKAIGKYRHPIMAVPRINAPSPSCSPKIAHRLNAMGTPNDMSTVPIMVRKAPNKPSNSGRPGSSLSPAAVE
jgi:hypothetical protein